MNGFPSPFSALARRRCGISRCLLALVLGVGISPPAAQAKSFAVAGWKDEDLRAHVQKIMKKRKEYAPAEPVVCLDRTILVSARKKKYTEAENTVFLVRDAMSAEEHATQHLDFDFEGDIEFVGGWVLRADGTILRLEKDDIIRHDGKKGRRGEAILSFPHLGEGDLFGYSYAIKHREPYWGDSVALALDVPIAEGKFVLLTKRDIAYRLTARNARAGHIETKAVKKNPDDTAAERLIAKFTNIGADREETFQVSALNRVPYVDVVRLFTRVDVEDRGSKRFAWFRANSWNHQSEFAVAIFRDFVGDADVEAIAREILARKDPGEDTVEFLFRHVRDSLVLDDSALAQRRFAVRSMEEALEEGRATANEKAFLLYALLRAANVEARLAYVRSYLYGRPDLKIPRLNQFSDVCVYVDDLVAQGRWLWPGSVAASPETLPPWLCRSAAFVVDGRAPERMDGIWDKALERHGYDLKLIRDDYHRRLDNAKLYAVVETPGNPFRLAGRQVERAIATDGGLETRIEVSGTAAPADLRAGEGESGRVDQYEEYLRWRWPVGEDATLSGLEAHREQGVLHLAAAFPDWTPPEPDGGLWILPLTVLLGPSEFERWEGPDRGRVQVTATTERETRIDLPLPSGWAQAIPPSGLNVDTPRFAYEAAFEVADGHLRITRRLTLRAGLSERSALPLLDEGVQKILAFEAAPAVVERAGGEGTR